MSKNRVAFIIDYIPFLHAMLPAIREVERRGIPFDVIVPPLSFGRIDFILNGRNDLLQKMECFGIKPICDLTRGISYSVVYSAYHGAHEELLSLNLIRYNIRYSYGLSGANKPDMTGLKYTNFYDFALCYGEPHSSFTSGYIKTFSIGNIKLADFKRSRTTPSGKKTVMYLPTWGSGGESVTSINAETINKLADLQNKYHIVTKMHGHTAYSEQQIARRGLFSVFDHVYDVNTPIAEILNDADVVLSDLSSAAFDAVAGDVPLALFGLGEPVYYGGKLCLHQQLVKDDIIPGSNNVDELEAVLEKALTPEYFAKQQKLKKELFPFEGKECLDAFMRFQDDLFNDRVDPWYMATRRAIRENSVKEQRDIQERFVQMSREHAQAVAQVVAQTMQAYENSTSWRLTKPLRSISKLLRGKERS